MFAMFESGRIPERAEMVAAPMTAGMGTARAVERTVAAAEVDSGAVQAVLGAEAAPPKRDIATAAHAALSRAEARVVLEVAGECAT